MYILKGFKKTVYCTYFILYCKTYCNNDDIIIGSFLMHWIEADRDGEKCLYHQIKDKRNNDITNEFYWSYGLISKLWTFK